jgi:hypothetical protein
MGFARDLGLDNPDDRKKRRAISAVSSVQPLQTTTTSIPADRTLPTKVPNVRAITKLAAARDDDRDHGYYRGYPEQAASSSQ